MDSYTATQIPAQSLACCMALGKTANTPTYQVPLLCNGDCGTNV